MALGEYVSVSSQRDSERADITKERWELEHLPERELDELSAIYQAKGLTPELAREVAIALTEHDPLGIHVAEELGISDNTLARPVQAGASSALSFALGGAIPLIAVTAASSGTRAIVTIGAVLLALVALGAAGATAGGAQPFKPMFRMVAGGILAMAFTMGVGYLFGSAVS
jgi:VIT1/CCC1 family predicted Fe2+/Mn2+ transporter